ncbi:hypothetical protein LEP1GSC047_0446 [Leptospira inadai serovar Lyme str. 10]|uniref:Uncharacterized protein n=2 Tax=Leptospira inadai serovar Lyme TaxID=293084 RepID=V6HBK9_9LEPT|nr:hypothetical protein [Leptospira inadai]EQA36023.1 hypothetical protein LEP1GSC047_0446 [Leptospira inadai serovar Lyme str. 10]PNV76925.1 hypothetical protein BES34_001220 [Leptospira inadai serovar Lyme]
MLGKNWSKLVLIFFLVAAPVYSNIPKYSELDRILLSTWNRTFPVPFTKIVKRDVSGKGILQYRKSSKKTVYIYTYLVFLPRYGEEAEKPVQQDGGREVKVKLFYDPVSSEKYEVELGEFDEAYDTRGIIRWIR